MADTTRIRTILATAEHDTERSDLFLLSQGRMLDLAIAVRAKPWITAGIADVILCSRARTVAGHAIQAAAREWREWIAERATV
ncbi:MAG: hypothetical protein ACOZAM_23760 [Pseudomonadota bacterium]